MRRFFRQGRRACAVMLGLALASGLAAGGGAQAESYTADVNPFIGTAGGGNTFPGASAPFGMVQFSPDTHAPSIGYTYDAKEIQGFSLTHMSGVGCDDEGDVFLTATTGPVQTDRASYSSPYSHAHETASPGSYQVLLDKWQTHVELTATERAGMARFLFPQGQTGNILIPISHTLTRTFASQVHIVGNDEIDGQVTSQSFCGANPHYTVYFVMQFDHPFQSYGVWTGTLTLDHAREAVQTDTKTPIGAYVRYPVNTSRAVQVRIGISYVDLAGARNNLRQEIKTWDFDQVRRQTEKSWEQALSVLDVQGGSPDDRTKFYTSLYHCLLMPSLFSDEDRRYIGFDDAIHQKPKGHAAYASYSGWDIYRTEAPLLALIAPQRAQDMCQSIVDMYQQGGWIDRWPQANTYTNVMCGSPLTTMIATTWNAGLHGFDIQTAYAGMWKDATEAPPTGKPYGGEAGVAYMDPLGYIPYDKVGYGAVSQTEEDCVAYAALASVSDALGKAADAQRMRKRALYYKNLYDKETGFLRPRDSAGNWLTPFDPASEKGYVEGSGWHYLWLAPQDVHGLIQLMGGDDAFNTKLDQFFSYPHLVWDNHYYNPYNEPDLQAPFLYDYSGAPWKTQARVRELLTDAYGTTPNGVPGNDDCGTMSAWYLFAAMGFYPVDTSRPTFEMCSPLFPKITLHLSSPYTGRTFVIEGQSDAGGGSYIQSAQLNGQALDRPWFLESDLTRGGTLSVNLGTSPNKQWGAGAQARPPSLTP